MLTPRSEKIKPEVELTEDNEPMLQEDLATDQERLAERNAKKTAILEANKAKRAEFSSELSEISPSIAQTILERARQEEALGDSFKALDIAQEGKVNAAGQQERDFTLKGQADLKGKIISPPDLDQTKPVELIFKFTQDQDAEDREAIKQEIEKVKAEGKIKNPIVVMMQDPAGRKIDLDKPEGLNFAKLFMGDFMSNIKKLAAESDNPLIKMIAGAVATFGFNSSEKNADSLGDLSMGGLKKSLASLGVNLDNYLPAEASATPSNSVETAEFTDKLASNESYLVKGNLAFLGDSNFAAFQNPNKFFNLEGKAQNHAKNGYTTMNLMNQLGINSSGEKVKASSVEASINSSDKIVINVGTNDIGSSYSAEQLQQNYTAIIKHLQSLGKTVYLTTIPPFGGYQSNPSYAKNAAQIEQKRIAINRFLLENYSNSASVKIIPLHLPASKGGAASDEMHSSGVEKLADQFNLGDNLHLKGQAFSQLLASYLGEKVSVKNSAKVSEKVSDKVSSKSNEIPTDSTMGATSENLKAGPPEGFGPIKGAVNAEVRAKAVELLSKLKLGQGQEINIGGVDYIFKAEMHSAYKNRSDGPTNPHKGISVYQKKS